MISCFLEINSSKTQLDFYGQIIFGGENSGKLFILQKLSGNVIESCILICKQQTVNKRLSGFKVHYIFNTLY